MAGKLSRELLIKLVGDLSGATKIETAVSRVQERVKRLTDAQAKLAGASHNAATGMLKMANNTGSVMKALDRFNPRIARTVSGLSGLISKIGMVNSSLAVAGASFVGRRVVGATRQGMGFNANVETAVNRMAAEIRQDKETIRSAMRRSQTETAWAMKYSREARIFSADTIQHALSDFAVLYRGDMAKARSATQTAALLAAKNPHQGIEGAKIAIQEAESGQWTSPQRRFFLPKSVLEKYKGLGGLGALQATLKEMKIDGGLLQAMGNTAPGMEKQIGAMKGQLAGQATSGLYQSRKDHLAFIRERMEGLTSEKGALTKIAKLTGELGGKLGKMFYGVLEFPVRNADKLLGFLKNLKRGLDPTIAVLKAFGKGIYAGFIQPFNMVVRQLQFTGGVMGKMAGIASKLLGIGGKVATSPLYMLAPLAGLLGRGAGTALAGKTVMKAMRYVGGPRGMFELAKKAGPAGRKLFKEMGIPMFPDDGAMHYADGGSGVGGNGYVPDAAGKERIMAAAQKSKRKRSAPKASRADGAQDFASILANLIESSNVGNVLGGMAGGNIADVLEKQFLNKLGFFDDLAKAGENLSTVVAGVFEGMQGLLSPVNALGVAVGALIAPFVLLGKVAKTITAPLNSKAGKMVGKIIGTGISPLLMPAMFALGTVGGVNMFKQLGGMVNEGPGSFKKGWTKRIFGSFVNGTDFQQGSRGAQGAGYVNVAGSYVQKGLAALGRMAGNPALGKAGPVLQGLIGRYSGLIGQGMSGMSPVQSGLGALAETGDAILSRMPGAQKKMMQHGINGINGMVRGEQRNISLLMNDRENLASGGMGKSELGKIDKEIKYRSDLLGGVQKMLSEIATPTTLKGLNELSSKVQSGLGQKPIQETLQDTIERMWVKTPDWLSELPIWHTEAPRWLVSLSDIMNRGGGGSGGQGSAAPAGGKRPSNIPIGGVPRRRNGRQRVPGQGASGAPAPVADNNQVAGMPPRLDPVPGLPPRPARPDPDPAPAPTVGPGGGLIDSLSAKWAKVSGWASVLGVDIKNHASVTAMLDGAKSLSGSLGGLPTAGLGILTGAIGAAGGMGGIAAGGIGSLYGHLKTGVMAHGAGILAQAQGLGLGSLSGLGAGAGGVLKSGLSLAGKTPMAIMGGLGNMSRFMGATLGLMWPMLLGGSAIAGITAIAKKVGGAMSTYGGGVRGMLGAGRAAFQLAESSLGNIGAKVGKVGGSVVGAGALMLLASKVPGKLKIPAMLLAGLFGGSVGGGLGETGGRMAGAGLPGGLMAMAALPLLRFGGAKLATRYGMNTIGGLAGRGMLGAAKFMDLPGQMFKRFDARFMGGAYDGARTKLLSGTKTGVQTAAAFLQGNTMPYLEKIATSPTANPMAQKAAQAAIRAGGNVAPILEHAMKAVKAARGMSVSKTLYSAYTLGISNSPFAPAGRAAQRGIMSLRASSLKANGGISSFLNKQVLGDAEVNMIKLVGRVGRFLVGTKPGKAVLGTAALLGIGGLAGSVNTSDPGVRQKAGGFFASIKERASTAYQFIGGRQTLDQTAGASILGGLLLGRGGLARIAASRGVAGFLGRAVTGSFGLSQGLYSKLGTAGIRAAASGGGRSLLGFAAKRSLAVLGPLGLMASAGMGGYDLGRYAMTQKIGGKTSDQRMLALMSGGIDARDARDKASFDAKYAKIQHVAQLKAAHQISQAQATAMVQQINRDADVGAKKVAEAGKSWFSTAWDWITGKSGPTPAAAAAGGKPPAIPGGGAPGPVPGQSFTGPQLPIGGKNGLDKLIMGMGHAEGWGLTKGKDGSWQMDRSNPATRAPFGLLGDSQKHPELMNNPQLLHDWMVGKLTGTASASVKGQGVSGFSSTVVPGLFNKDGSLNPDKIGELQKKWAPNGAANDPKGLNGNWLGNVMSSLGTPDVKQPNSPASFPGAGTGGSSAISLAFNVASSGSGTPAEQAKSILSSISTDPAIKAQLTDHILKTTASPAGQRAIATRK